MDFYCASYINVFISFGFLLLLVHWTPVCGDKCAELMNIDCDTQYKPEGDETLCCSDFNVYNNLCHFAQAKCRDPSLTSLYPGPCTTNPSNPDDSKSTLSTATLTTPNPAVVTTPVDVIHDVFCDHAPTFVCPEALDPICGSDNHFYKNPCCFAKAQCNNTALVVQADLDICKVALRFRREVQCG